MTSETQRLRAIFALLRILLGVIILTTWASNLYKGLYTAQGITDLLTHPDWGAFTHGGGALPGYRFFIENTVLRWPGPFALFQLVAEFLIGLGLLLGAFTTLAGLGASFFFLNLLLTYLGNTEEWLWTYVLLLAVALAVTAARAGLTFGLDARLQKRRR